METVKKIIKHLLFPHVAVIIPLVPLCTSMLIYSFLFIENPHAPVNYVAYVLSAYTLAVVCIRTPHFIRFFRSFKQENYYVNRYMTDRTLRVKISLYSSLIINTAYAVFQLGLGFYHASVWFYALAAYYVLLAVMRFFLLKDVRAGRQGEDLVSEYKRYRFCGVVLLLMNLALAVIVFYITWQNRTFHHHEITTISLAAYTFGALSMAIVKVVKYRKYNSPVLWAARVISLAAASVSMLTLESTMLTTFGDESIEAYRGLFTGLTGGAVCIMVVGIAIYMILRANNALKEKR